MDALKGGRRLEPPYETMMFTSTLQQENNRLTRFWSMFPFGNIDQKLWFNCVLRGHKIENWQRLRFSGILTIARTRFSHFILLENTNLWFSGIFRRYKMGKLARNGLIK